MSITNPWDGYRSISDSRALALRFLSPIRFPYSVEIVITRCASPSRSGSICSAIGLNMPVTSSDAMCEAVFVDTDPTLLFVIVSM